MLSSNAILQARILIVDDQQANVMLLQDMLQQAGYSNVSATSAPETVCALHRDQAFDLILLDLQMPGMDGFAVMDALRLQEPHGYVPVLVITAQPGHKLRALQAGAKDFVGKPFDVLEVKTRIHNMLEVRLLYAQLDAANQVLEQKVAERTAQLQASEARFKSFAELSSDWYWEQDAAGNFTSVFGPAFEMLGIASSAALGAPETVLKGWNLAERAELDANIAARRPFLDFIYSRQAENGAMRYMQVSGEPMFDAAGRFIGYRGIGMDVSERMLKYGSVQTMP